MLVFLSTIVLLVILLGLKYRRRAVIHIPIMIVAFIMDIALVLYIEWNRHAIAAFGEGVLAPTENTFLLFHVTVSLITILLYIALIVTGFKLFKGQHIMRITHRNLAGLFIVFRLVNYVTSFWMV